MWQSQIKKISKWVPLRGVGGGGAIQVCTLSAQKVDLKTQKWQNTNNKKNSTKKGGGGGSPFPSPVLIRHCMISLRRKNTLSQYLKDSMLEYIPCSLYQGTFIYNTLKSMHY